MSYYVRVPLYTDTDVLCGYVQAAASTPEKYYFDPEYMQANAHVLFENVSGSWYHLDPDTGDTTSPAHIAD
jgi:glucan-binding YG repeat protein